MPGRAVPRTALAALAALLVAGCSVAGCTVVGSTGTDGGGRTAAPAAPASSSAERPSHQLTLCPGRPAARLTAALSRALPASLHAEVVPLGVTAGGTTAYASAWTTDFAGVAALSLGSGRLRRIARFPDPANDQAEGAWGGRWLVWTQTMSLTSLDSFTVRAWDSVTGRTLLLGHSLAGPGGTPWPSPWHAPAVSGHFAAWAQGSGPGGVVQIRVADLRTGRVRVVATGHVQAPFFDKGLVVWPASTAPGTLTSLHAYDVTTGEAAALPPVLRGVSGTDFVVTDGTRTAYFDPGLKRLYYSPAQDQAAAVVLRLPGGNEFANLGMAAGALAWTTTRATYLASTTSGGYVRVTPAYGFAVTGAGSAVLVSDAPVSRSAHPALALHVLDAAGIVPSRC
jgi:hypothetical protein